VICWGGKSQCWSTSAKGPGTYEVQFDVWALSSGVHTIRNDHQDTVHTWGNAVPDTTYVRIYSTHYDLRINPYLIQSNFIEVEALYATSALFRLPHSTPEPLDTLDLRYGGFSRFLNGVGLTELYIYDLGNYEYRDTLLMLSFTPKKTNNEDQEAGIRKECCSFT
jgi:hypothetical protein